MVIVLELLDIVIGREERVSDEEHEVQEGTELDGPTMACALEVLKVPQAGVETQDDQVGDASGCLIGGRGCCRYDGVDDGHRGGLLSFNWGVFDPICFEFLGKALV